MVPRRAQYVLQGDAGNGSAFLIEKELLIYHSYNRLLCRNRTFRFICYTERQRGTAFGGIFFLSQLKLSRNSFF